jgi:hypothetical protein
VQTRTADLYRVKVKRSITYSRLSSVFIELQSDDLDSIWTPRLLGVWVWTPVGLQGDSGGK